MFNVLFNLILQRKLLFKLLLNNINKNGCKMSYCQIYLYKFIWQLTNSLKIGYDEYRNLFGNKTAEILQHHPITHTTIDIIESNTFIYNIPLYSYFKSNKLLKYYAFQLPGKT